MRVALPVSIALALALLAGGCGSGERSYGGKSSTETPTERAPGASTTPEAPPGASAESCAGHSEGVRELRVTSISCAVGSSTARAWSRANGCWATADASHRACSVGDFRCISTSTDRGVAVSCARPGRSLSFIARRG